MKEIKICVVEDQTILRESIVLALSMEECFRIVGHWKNAENSLEFLRNNNCDVIITELALSGMNGALFASKAKDLHPRMKILVLTDAGRGDQVFAAYEAGVSGYLQKDISITELVRAIKNVAMGEEVFSPSLTRSIMLFARRRNGEHAGTDYLTDEQAMVLRLVSRGFANKEIADALNLSIATVKFRLKEIFRILKVRGRAHAVARGFKLGILSCEEYPG